MAWEWLDSVDELIGQYGGSSTSGHTWDDILNAMNTNYTDMLSDVWGNALDIQGSGIYYLGDDGNQSKQYLTSYNLRIQLGTVWSDWSPGCVRIQKMSEPMLGMNRNGNTTTATFRFMVNYATEELTAWCIVQYDNQYTQFQNMISSANRENCALWYNFLKDHSAPPITYNWQSVPSISGKNGILQSLVQIKEEALNDGEPVSEATVLSFDSLGNINIPSVIDEQMPVDPSDVTSVTATYLIPALEDGTYEGIKLLVKKNSIPTSEEDADKVIDLSEPTSILRIDSKSVGNLDEDSHYYFMIKLVDEIGTEATSDPKDIWTSHSEGYNFDYTGEIVEWTVPKTGIYSLETWGAQGGDATDGTNSARGGYGAYAYGEVLLTQGEKLYINVGGQNGYGGGGKKLVEYTLQDVARTLDFSLSNCKTAQGSIGSPQDLGEWFDTDHCLVWYDAGTLLNYLPTYSNGEITGQSCGDFGYMAIPINLEGKNLVGFRCKLKTSRTASGWTYCSTALIRLVDDSTGYYGVQGIFYTEDGSAIPTSYTDITKTISSQITPNYLYLSIYSNYALCMKDIVFICEE